MHAPGPAGPSGPCRAAVLGSPIAHSKSPALHLAAYAAAGLDWRYDAIDVSESQLADFVAALGPRWVGLSLTMPLKQVAARVVETLDPVAAVTGVVNTIVLPSAPTEPESVVGANTDVEGIVAALREAGVHTPERVTILGAGATARSAAVAAVQLGATDVTICARRREAADDVAAIIDEAVTVEATGWQPAVEPLAADVVISTVPAGVADEWTAEVGRLGGSERGVLLDVVYDPWPTALAAAWQQATPEARVVPGLAMLLWQAAAQVRLMVGCAPDVAAMAAAVGLPTPIRP